MVPLLALMFISLSMTVAEAEAEAVALVGREDGVGGEEDDMGGCCRTVQAEHLGSLDVCL